MRIRYLTWLYEKTGKHEETIEIPENVKTISELLDHLSILNPHYGEIFKNRHVIYSAINNETAPHSSQINDSDEVTFFSAMVGG